MVTKIERVFSKRIEEVPFIDDVTKEDDENSDFSSPEEVFERVTSEDEYGWGMDYKPKHDPPSRRDIRAFERENQYYYDTDYDNVGHFYNGNNGMIDSRHELYATLDGLKVGNEFYETEKYPPMCPFCGLKMDCCSDTSCQNQALIVIYKNPTVMKILNNKESFYKLNFLGFVLIHTNCYEVVKKSFGKTKTNSLIKKMSERYELADYHEFFVDEYSKDEKLKKYWKRQHPQAKDLPVFYLKNPLISQKNKTRIIENTQQLYDYLKKGTNKKEQSATLTYSEPCCHKFKEDMLEPYE